MKDNYLEMLAFQSLSLYADQHCHQDLVEKQNIVETIAADKYGNM